LRIEQLQSLGDLTARQQITDHLGSKYLDQAIRRLEKDIYVVGPTKLACGTTCFYHLVRLVDGVVTKLFSLRASGWILLSVSELDKRSEQFGVFNQYIFETPGRLYVGIGLPRSGDTVLVETIPSGQMWRCN
jgi:hypothetical protein